MARPKESDPEPTSAGVDLDTLREFVAAREAHIRDLPGLDASRKHFALAVLADLKKDLGL